MIGFMAPLHENLESLFNNGHEAFYIPGSGMISTISIQAPGICR
jgi:hypothetical protein